MGGVAARTHSSGQPLTAYVLGVRGQTSQQVAARFSSDAAARLPAGCHGRVVLAVGVNDTTLLDGAPRVPAAYSAGYLEQVLQPSREAGWPALVVGPPPIADGAQNERIAQLDAVLAQVCAAARVGCVRVFDQLLDDPVWMREVAEGDGAHPGTAGYRRLADLVWPHWHGWIHTDPT